MTSEGNEFIELIENLKAKQTSLKESIFVQEEEKKVLYEQLQTITEDLKLNYRASIKCDKVIKDAEDKYEQFTKMYTKSQKLLANLENDEIDADDFPIEMDTTELSTHSTSMTCRKLQAGKYITHMIPVYTHTCLQMYTLTSRLMSPTTAVTIILLDAINVIVQAMIVALIMLVITLLTVQLMTPNPSPIHILPTTMVLSYALLIVTNMKLTAY